MSSYGDFPGVTVNTNSSVSPDPPDWISIHIDNANEDFLPLRLAIEENWEIYIYGPDERASEIHKKTQELQKDYKFAHGVVTP